MLSETQLHQLRKELHPALSLMQQAATTIQDEEVSNYPVFVLFSEEEDASLGIPLLAADSMNVNWNVHVSTLEELASKQVVAMEKVKDFTALYKSHTNDLCCLVYTDGQAQFVFIPIS